MPRAQVREQLPRRQIAVFYRRLLRALGPQHWWPARTRFEVIVGAILTQNTAWQNVRRTIENLRRAGLLSFAAMRRAPRPELATLLRPSGYFNQKAKKLDHFLRFVVREHGGSLARMFRQPTARLRDRLLGLNGIGPETADSILLYAGGRPAFVVDAYTRRILARHGLIREEDDYEEIKRLFEANLPRSVRTYNEYHALLVEVGKRFCRPRQADCAACPLGSFLTKRQRWQIQKKLAPAGS